MSIANDSIALSQTLYDGDSNHDTGTRRVVALVVVVARVRQGIVVVGGGGEKKEKAPWQQESSHSATLATGLAQV